MEEAINDFAGEAGVDKDADKKPTPPPKPRMKTDCVVLGYRVGAGGKLQSLVLGTAYRDKLVYACSVSPQLTDEESVGLLQMLSDSQSPQAYVSTAMDAQWVVPKFSCRVSYERQEETGRLMNAKWEEFLGQIR
jgi:ATP-dependent DNA ligase